MSDPRYTLLQGDCAELAKTLSGIDAIITDPPYGFKFMGKKWDYQVPTVAQWEALLAACKPGAHLASFGGSRTYHRMACNVEDGGWEIRDQIMWLYGSGFPKSLDISKAIDATLLHGGSNSRRMKATNLSRGGNTRERSSTTNNGIMGDSQGEKITNDNPSTDAAKQWDGWGTALKPAHEPIVLARKPIKGTVAANVLAYGVGGLNIDECRVEANGDKTGSNGAVGLTPEKGWNANAMSREVCREQSTSQGRWPANVIHDGSNEVVGLFPATDSGKPSEQLRGRRPSGFGDVGAGKGDSVPNGPQYGDKGSAARFFYCPKVSKRERGEGNNHPTVKPIALMEYIIRLTTPEGALVLDPFMGSGSTAIACLNTGRRFIGIEQDPHNYAIAAKRIADWLKTKETKS